MNSLSIQLQVKDFHGVKFAKAVLIICNLQTWLPFFSGYFSLGKYQGCNLVITTPSQGKGKCVTTIKYVFRDIQSKDFNGVKSPPTLKSLNKNVLLHDLQACNL
jgi:hypothetical protein